MLPRLYLYLRKKNSNFQSLLNSDEMTLLHSEQLSQPDDLIITLLVYVDWKKKKVCFSSQNHSDSVFRSKDKKRKKKERNTDLGKHLPYTSNESDFRESTTCTGLFWTSHVTLQPLLTDGQFHLTDLVCSAGSTLQKIFCVKIFF